MPGKGQASVVKEEEKKKLDMTIEIKDFGPISSGKITLKPLTVFIGPNNSGKSYAAMLIHSIFQTYYEAARPGCPHILEYIGPEKVYELVTQPYDDPGHLTEALVGAILKVLYHELLSREIGSLFACPLSDLIRMGKGFFTVGINYDSGGVHLTCQGNKLQVRRHSQFNVQANAEIKSGASENNVDQLMAKVDFLIPGICYDMLENVIVKCYYLSAARSGITQVYRMLAANIIRQVTNIDIPDTLKLPVGAADLISSLIDLPEEKTPFYELVRDFEEKMIEGEILHPFSNGRLSEIKYRFNDTEIPLSRSSSAIPELAPILLYLKHKVKPRNILIIDEPEAHLHPKNQRTLARLLVRLVREDVNVIITTHSEYLLEQLSNFIMLSEVGEGKRKRKYKYDKEDFLKPSEVACYVFNYDAESLGYRIDEVEITKEDGISDDEFIKVTEALYEETVKLRRELITEA